MLRCGNRLLLLLPPLLLPLPPQPQPQPPVLKSLLVGIPRRAWGKPCHISLGETLLCRAQAGPLKHGLLLLYFQPQPVRRLTKHGA